MTDREKAIEILQKLADDKAEELYICDDEGGDVCSQILKEQNAILSGIEALEVRPYGEWIWQTEDKYRCSVCGKNTRVEEVMNEPQYNFCPFCGADMRKECGNK